MLERFGSGCRSVGYPVISAVSGQCRDTVMQYSNGNPAAYARRGDLTNSSMWFGHWGGLGAFLCFAVKDEELAAVYQRLLELSIVCYSEPRVVELPGFGTLRAVVVEGPDGQMIELTELPAADEIRRVRAAFRVQRSQPT